MGDFNGDGRDDLAVGFASTPDGGPRFVANLGVATFNTDRSIRSDQVTQPVMNNGQLPPPLINDPARTGSGIELEAGLFRNDPANGFTEQRRQLAIGWVGYQSKALNSTPNGPVEKTQYTLTPEFQLYSVADKACDSAGTSCTTTVALGAGADPSVVFPTTKNAVWVVSGAQPYDAFPLTLEAGAYAGTAATAPPVWGLVASIYEQLYNDPITGPVRTFRQSTSLVVPWTKVDPKAWTITDTYELDQNTNFNQERYTAYDPVGASLVLGPPAVFNVEQQLTEDLLAAQPPAHVDWIDGELNAVSADPDFYLETSASQSDTFSHTSTNKNGQGYGASQGADVKASLTAGVGPFSAKSSAEVSESFTESWDGLDTTSSNSSAKISTTVEGDAVTDDIVNMSTHDFTVYRYPVLGTLGDVTSDACDPSATCRGYYEVTLPGDTVYLTNMAGRGVAGFEPSWQNGNALSYPVLNQSGDPLPLPDLGTYSYPDDKGDTQEVKAALFNEVVNVSGNKVRETLDFSKSQGATAKRTTSHGWTSDTELKATALGSVGVPAVGDVGLKVEVTAGLKTSNTFAATTTGTTDSSSDENFTLNIPQFDAAKAYRVGTAFYYSQAGTPKIVHGVDLTTDELGTQWWSDTYKAEPDPALNLPNAIIFGKDTDDQYTLPYWNKVSSRQSIRGFETLQVSSETAVPTAGLPYATSPLDGDAVQFRVQVSNRSLTDMPGTVQAHFSAVPVDADTSKATGPAVQIGATTVSTIAAQSTAEVVSPSWTASADGESSQNYRIFVQLDPEDSMPEIHELDGTACPASSLDPATLTPAGLMDLMSQTAEPDPLACGQNNQGFGSVTVLPSDGIGAAAGLDGAQGRAPGEAANVELDGAGLIDGNDEHLFLTETSEIPTVAVDSTVHGLVRATSDYHSRDAQTVIVYDGDPAEGNAIYMGTMDGVSAQNGGHAQFTWNPKTPGLHELHQVILGTNGSGEDDEQILRVNVTDQATPQPPAAPGTAPFTVTAQATPGAVVTGQRMSINGTVQPTQAETTSRTVTLQRRTDAGWKDVARKTKTTSPDGAFSIGLRHRRAGAFDYRVLKTATAERPAAYSPTIRVRVRRAFAVTARAPARMLSGRALTISAGVTPVSTRAADRGMRLQVKTLTGWRNVMLRRSAANGRIQFTTRPGETGTLRYRVKKAATPQRPAAYSPTIVVNVLERS